ncbi:MAG: hypothetical protein LBT40_09835 [Deltaproteobacteria bacterium]|nr:hypothetical protein [Deltaproteobacteria bacterium]
MKMTVEPGWKMTVKLGGKTTVKLGGKATVKLGGKATVKLGGKTTVKLGGKMTVKLGGKMTAKTVKPWWRTIVKPGWKMTVKQWEQVLEKLGRRSAAGGVQKRTVVSRNAKGAASPGRLQRAGCSWPTGRGRLPWQRGKGGTGLILVSCECSSVARGKAGCAGSSKNGDILQRPLSMSTAGPDSLELLSG